MADPDPEEIREQIVDAFEGVEYPVANRMEFPPRLSDGPATMFEPGMRSFFVALVSLTIAMHGFNLATHLGEELEDPSRTSPSPRTERRDLDLADDRACGRRRRRRALEF